MSYVSYNKAFISLRQDIVFLFMFSAELDINLLRTLYRIKTVMLHV
jgi:hypothetical protein